MSFLHLICNFLIAKSHLVVDDCSDVFPDDYRLFCGDLGNEVNDDVLSKAFQRFPSFNMAKVSFLSLHKSITYVCSIYVSLSFKFSFFLITIILLY